MPRFERQPLAEHEASSARSGSQSWPHHAPSDYDLYVVQMRRLWHPPTDVYETDQHIVVKVEIAGMQEDDFDIALDSRRLVVRGVRPAQEGKVVYQNMEIHYGQFRSEVEINVPIDRSSIDASYQDGFLYVKLRMADRRTIPVRVKGRADDQG